MTKKKEMKMREIIFAIITVCVFSSCSHKVYHQVAWQSSKITTDGKITEWPNPLRFFEPESRINFSISNDRRNLYVCMKISDETTLTKIIKEGMEFRIDTLGQKTVPIALIFPIADQQLELNTKNEYQNQTRKKPGANNSSDANPKSDNTAIIKKQLSRARKIRLVGFKPPLAGIITLPEDHDTSGIAAAIKFDSLGIMYYEAVIPFSTFYKDELTATDTNRVFTYEIKINAPPKPPGPVAGVPGAAGVPMGGAGGGGMGGAGMGGGGMGGGGMGGRGMAGGGASRTGVNGMGNGMNNGGNAYAAMYAPIKMTVQLRFAYK